MDGTPNYCFASDNTSGMCPEVMQTFVEVNRGRVPSYGDDVCTAEATNAFRALFETACDVYFVFTGTAANSLSLASLCQSYHSVIVHEFAHVETDECGAPEFFSNGTKLLLASGANGKMDPLVLEQIVLKRRDIHFPKPRVVSLSCPTELGTVYTPAEVSVLAEAAKRHGLRVHMDGARFANAVASLGVSPAELTWKAGVDVLAFGGTKLGSPVGEAVVFFDPALGEEFAYRCKQAGQLASKMRFLAAPWKTLLSANLWLEIAARANGFARLLRLGFEQFPELRLLHPTEANAVFVEMPEHVHQHLKSRGWRYYSFIGGGSRFMCSWSTTNEDVEALLDDVRSALS